MGVSSQKFGGCSRFQYGCESTDTTSLTGLYTENLAKPPEGDHETVAYALCCVKFQCHLPGAVTSVDQCGTPPVPAARLYDADTPSMTKPGGIMMLAACAAAFVMASIGIACMPVRVRHSNRAPI